MRLLGGAWPHLPGSDATILVSGTTDPHPSREGRRGMTPSPTENPFAFRKASFEQRKLWFRRGLAPARRGDISGGRGIPILMALPVALVAGFHALSAPKNGP